MTPTSLLLAPILLLCSVWAAAAEVVELDSSNLDQELAKGGRWMIKFYAPWCGHCKRLAPAYREAAEELDGEVTFAQVDGAKDAALSQRFNVRGYPTMFLVEDGKVYEYNGVRTKEVMVTFATRAYKTSEPLSMWVSPLGPVGKLKGTVLSFGLSIVSFHDFLVESVGLSKWAVVVGFVSVGVFVMVTVMSTIIYFVVPSDPPMHAHAE